MRSPSPAPMGSQRWRAPLLRALVTLVALVCALACGGDGAPDPAPPAEPEVDELSYEAFSTTRLLERADLEAITSLTEDGSITFAPAPAALDDLAPGMVLVGGQSTLTPEGLLRGVGEVSREGDRLTVRTMVVPIQLAFRRLSVHSAHRIRDISQAQARPADELSPRHLRVLDTDGTGKKSLKWVLFDGDGDEATLDDQVRLEGDLGGGFYFDARFDVDWGAVTNLPQTVADCLKSIPGIIIGKLPDCTPLALLPEARATFTVGPDLSAHADLIGSASLEFQKELAIVKLALSPIPVGFIVLVPGVDVLATLSGSAGAHFRTGFDASLSARMALVASTKNGVSVTPPTLERSDVVARETELAIMARGRVSLGARISMSVYGILGPYAQVDGFAELAADTSKDPCWAISAGLTAEAGLLLTTPRLPVLGYVTLFKLQTPTWEIFRTGALASGSCGFAKGTPLPGTGPDEKSYGQPSFPTWSTVTTLPGDPLFPTTAALSSDLAFSQMERTTDGRFLTAAAGSAWLRKVDEQGGQAWAHRYSVPDQGDLRLGRLATLRDSSVVIASGVVDGPAVLRVGQAGGAFGGAVLSSAEGCQPGPIAAVVALPPAWGDPLEAPDYAVSGSCLDASRSYLATVTSAGVIRQARVLSVPAPSTLVPRAMTMVDGSLWWLGAHVAGGISHVAAVRLDAALAPQASGAYTGACENNRRLEPAFARPAALRSELLVVGSSGALHEGLLLRLRPDASVAVGVFPTFGPGASDVSVLQSIAELPTTGYVVSGSHRDVLAPDGSRERHMAPFVAWLDSGGSVLFARRLWLDDGVAETSSPRIELTTDGGLVMAATRARPGDQHDLWNLKAFARDGAVADPRVIASPFPFKATSCGVTTTPLPVDITPLGLVARPFDLTTH